MFRKTTLAMTGAVLLCAATVTLSAPKADTVSVAQEAIVAAGSPANAAAATTSACSDTAYAYQAWHLTSTYKWYYNGAGAPSSVATTALATVRTASQDAASGRNRCGTKVALSMAQQYMGTTGKSAQITADGKCAGSDGVSVASWGSLPPGVLAVTCTYYQTGNGAVMASDVRIDNTAHRWFTTIPAKCSGAFDLQAVMMHERGHTAGLAHVDQATHAVETMSPKTMACDTSKRGFAAGDLRGLTARY